MAGNHAIPDRETIVAVAVRLFSQYGFENVSAAQISAESGVSRRTFFRYFGSKQDVLFHYHEQTVSRLRELLLDPAEPGDLAHLGRCLREIFAGDYGQEWAIIMAEPSLRARWSVLAGDYERVIGERLIRFGISDLRAAILAGACVGALLAAHRFGYGSRESGTAHETEAMIEAVLAVLAEPWPTLS